ncbi:MAG: S41 family peptidase [Bacteroidetes bacterium]|nr:S41 family peptidase [Bacteroidota bacterium]
MTKYKPFGITVLILAAAIALSAAGSGFFEISKQLDIFITLYKTVDELYVDELDHAKVMRKGIDAMLSSLDPYTVYYSESEVEDYEFQRTGTYAGIGGRIMEMDGHLVVGELYESGPAIAAGIKVGDILLAIDGKSVVGKSVDEMSEILRGEENTPVTLSMTRKGSPYEVTFKRAEVKVDNVSYYAMVAPEVGYVKFEAFKMDAAEEVREKLDELKALGMKSLVLDMRGNPGGLLKEAVDLVNLFIDQNNLVVSTKGKNQDHTRDYKTYRKPYDNRIPVVVLVDGGSASASEIVSGSFQDYDRGVVVGRNSYGKGLVQVTQPLSYNGQVKVTTSKYYTASGRCIQRLDYASRDEDGNVPDMPDSLIQVFKTKSGREVNDGAGVMPDVEVSLPPRSPYVRALINGHHIFWFAVEWLGQMESVPAPDKLVVTDADLDRFKAFLEARKFAYAGAAEKKLQAIKDKLESEPNAEAIGQKINETLAYIAELKTGDFESDKDLVRNLIRLEMAKQAHYQRGWAQSSLAQDPDLTQALDLLNNPTAYQALLRP